MSPWTARDLFHLRTRYGRVSVARLARELGRTEQAIRGKACVLGLRKKPAWTRTQNAFLLQHYRTSTCAELAERLGHTPQAVRQQARRLRLGRENASWSKDDVAFLEANYDHMTARELGAARGFTESQVWNKASALGLRKREAMTIEAEWVLWELRDVPGVAEYFSREFGVGLPAVRRSLGRLKSRGGPSSSPGNLPI